MLLGRNTLEWNQATMREAVAYYLDNVIFKTAGLVDVIGVVQAANRTDGCFTITIEAKEKKS